MNLEFPSLSDLNLFLFYFLLGSLLWLAICCRKEQERESEPHKDGAINGTVQQTKGKIQIEIIWNFPNEVDYIFFPFSFPSEFFFSLLN